MEYPLSNRKISKTLDLLQLNYQNPSKLKDLSPDLPTFLIFYLSSSVRVEDTNKLFQYLDKYIALNPKKFLIPLSGYFSHGLIKDKPKILNLFKVHYFSNPDILKRTIFGLVLSTFRAIAESNEISKAAIEMLDDARRNFRIYECTWEVVLGSPKARMAALNYLNYRLVVDDKIRALHALLNCLEDLNLSVRKSAFGLIKRIFPFDSREVDKGVKVVILQRSFELFVSDRSLPGRVELEWIKGTNDRELDDSGAEIIAEAILNLPKALTQEELISFHTYFLSELAGYQRVLRKILVPLAINYCKAERNLPEDFQRMLLKNSVEFWAEYRDMFLKSFTDQSSQKELFEVADQILIQVREPTIIEFLVRSLLQHSNENPEVYLKFTLHLLEYIKRTSITLTELEEFAYRSTGDWNLIVSVLIRFFHLSVDCQYLIQDICEENVESDEDKISSLWFLLKYSPEDLTKDDVVLVFEYSLDTNKTELLKLIIELVPTKINKELKILTCYEPQFALECLILANPLGLKYTASLFIEVAKTFAEDDDYDIKFLVVKWLNQVISKKIDIFTPLLKHLDVDSRKSEEKSKKILESLKFVVNTGGWPVLKLMVHITQRKILTKLEQFLIRPPYNSNNFKIVACELASEIIVNSPSEFSASLVDVGLEILVKGISYDETWLLLVLVDFFDNLLFALAGEAEYEITSRGLVNILDPLTKLIAYPNTLVRNAWLDFIKRLVPFMLKYLDSSTSLNYFNNILRTYFTILSNTNDNKILDSLETLTRQLLKFHDEEEPDLMKTIKKLLFFFLQKYLDLSLSSFTEQLTVSKSILKEIFDVCPDKFIKKIVIMWVEDCLYNSETWNSLQQYIEIIAAFGLDLYEVFKKFRQILEEKFESNQENNEKILTISCVLCKFQEKVKTEKAEIWSEAILIYQKIFLVNLPEICFFVSYSLIMLKSQVTWAGLSKNELLTLTGLVKNCMASCLLYTNSSLVPQKLPYPLISDKPIQQVSELYLCLMNTCFHQIVDIGII